MAHNQYISSKQLDNLLGELNYSVEPWKKEELLVRATADLEAELSQRFVVPLISETDATYAGSPPFAVNKVLSTLKEKLRSIIGIDANRQLAGTTDSNGNFISLHEDAFRKYVKEFMNEKILYGFKQQSYADGAIDPVQQLALSRADNRTEPTGSGRGGTGWFP